MTEEKTTTTTTEERAMPCFVRHEDAGGKCCEPSAVRVYGLPFCEAHGEEVRIGASMEEQHVVRDFLERFRTPIARMPVERALERVREPLDSNTTTGAQQWQALRRAYSDLPAELVTRVREWILDEHPGHEDTVVDYLMDALDLIHKLMRMAYEEGAHWMVERLEAERESLAAQAAVALEELESAEREARDA